MPRCCGAWCAIRRRRGGGGWASLCLSVTCVNGFAYLLSLGFRKGSLLPRRWRRLLIGADRILAPLARYSGMRALAVWERQEGSV